MFRELIAENDTLTRIERTIMNELAGIYEDNLPDTLYMNQYHLSHEFGFTHNEWKNFLRNEEVDRLIEAEIAQIAEIGARSALAALQSGHAQAADISAARELIANSRLLQQKHNQRPQVIITRIPAKEVEIADD